MVHILTQRLQQIAEQRFDNVLWEFRLYSLNLSYAIKTILSDCGVFELLRSSEAVQTNEGEEKSRATGAQLINIIYTLHNQSR